MGDEKVSVRVVQEWKYTSGRYLEVGLERDGWTKC